jgi:hypothetical protein
LVWKPKMIQSNKRLMTDNDICSALESSAERRRPQTRYCTERDIIVALGHYSANEFSSADVKKAKWIAGEFYRGK